MESDMYGGFLFYVVFNFLVQEHSMSLCFLNMTRTFTYFHLFNFDTAKVHIHIDMNTGTPGNMD